MSNANVETNRGHVRMVEEEVVVTSGRPSSAATPQSFAQRVSEAARDNPASAALITMGVAWLFLGGSKVSLFTKAAGQLHAQGSRLAEADSDYPLDEYGHAPSAYPKASLDEPRRPASSAAADRLKQAGSALGDRVSATVSGVSEAASHAHSGLEVATRAAADAVWSAKSAAYRTSREVTTGARREAEHLQQSLGSFLESQPLAVGLLGLAAGAAVAAMLPKTRVEQKLLGETSDAVKVQAYDLASEQLASVRRVAETALEEAAREARAQGLSEETIAGVIRTFSEKLADVASIATDSLKSEISKATASTKKA